MRMPSRTQNSWALEGKQRKPERERERGEFLKGQREGKKKKRGRKLEGFM